MKTLRDSESRFSRPLQGVWDMAVASSLSQRQLDSREEELYLLHQFSVLHTISLQFNRDSSIACLSCNVRVLPLKARVSMLAKNSSSLKQILKHTGIQR